MSLRAARWHVRDGGELCRVNQGDDEDGLHKQTTTTTTTNNNNNNNKNIFNTNQCTCKW